MRAGPDLSGRSRHSEDQREEKEAKRQRVEVLPPTSGTPETVEVDMGTGGPAATPTVIPPVAPSVEKTEEYLRRLADRDAREAKRNKIEQGGI